MNPFADAYDFRRNAALAALCIAFNLAIASVAIFRLVRATKHAGRWSPWLAASSVVAIVAAAGQSVSTARERMPPLTFPMYFHTGAMAKGLAAHLDTLAATALFLPPALLAGIVATSLAITARVTTAPSSATYPATAATPRPGPPPLGLLVALLAPALSVFFPLWIGAVAYVYTLSAGHGRVARLPDGADRVSAMASVLADGRDQLTLYTRLALMCLAVGVLIAVANIRKFAANAPVPAGSSGRGAWLGSAVMFAGAVLVFGATVPLRAENQTPWSKHRGSQSVLGIPFDTPSLSPGDDAPVVTSLAVDESTLRVNFSQVELANIADALASTEIGKGDLVFGCSPGVGVARIGEVLRAAADAGYSTVWFTFRHRAIVERPVLGSVVYHFGRSARVSLGAKGTAAARVDLMQHRDCATLSAEIVAHRGAGRSVELAL